ncbi:MAG: hypothetical protein DCC49_13355 [Acidobacteria bacterium]|nr:MAG: hypothetical protein DCC49_13355 [Acidobacteriota bacterium]
MLPSNELAASGRTGAQVSPDAFHGSSATRLRQPSAGRSTLSLEFLAFAFYLVVLTGGYLGQVGRVVLTPAVERDEEMVPLLVIVPGLFHVTAVLMGLILLALIVAFRDSVAVRMFGIVFVVVTFCIGSVSLIAPFLAVFAIEVAMMPAGLALIAFGWGLWARRRPTTRRDGPA